MSEYPPDIDTLAEEQLYDAFDACANPPYEAVHRVIELDEKPGIANTLGRASVTVAFDEPDAAYAGDPVTTTVTITGAPPLSAVFIHFDTTGAPDGTASLVDFCDTETTLDGDGIAAAIYWAYRSATGRPDAVAHTYSPPESDPENGRYVFHGAALRVEPTK